MNRLQKYEFRDDPGLSILEQVVSKSLIPAQEAENSDCSMLTEERSLGVARTHGIGQYLFLLGRRW